MDELIICDLDLQETSELPEWIKIVPLGKVKSTKGDFIVDQESLKAMSKHMSERNLDIVVDYEHQTLKDVQAPAGGWIKELRLGTDAIEAKVEWTEKAKEYLKNKEYRFLSPVINVRKSDKKAVELHSVALTNTPAINGMFPIINKLGSEEGERKTMDLKKLLLEVLGLPEETTDEALIEMIKAKCNPANEHEVVANKTVLTLLGLKEDAKTEEVCASIMSLKQSPEIVELKALKERLDKQDADQLVNEGLKAGKISAAQKAWAEAYALKDREGFKNYLELAPQTVPMGEINTNTETKLSAELDPIALKNMGISKEDIEKYGGNE